MLKRNAKIARAILYIAAAVLIFIFHEKLMPYVGYVVGAVVLLWSVNEIVMLANERKVAHLGIPITQFLITLLLFLAAEDIVKVCVIWGVWSILRESREMTEALSHLAKRRLGLLNVAESIVVIVLSVTMILEPGHHHAHTHVILLGIEIILEIVFPLANDLFER